MYSKGFRNKKCIVMALGTKTLKLHQQSSLRERPFDFYGGGGRKIILVLEFFSTETESFLFYFFECCLILDIFFS